MPYDSENHLVHRFGELIDTWPPKSLSSGASHIIIIGNEVATPGAGDGGGTGAIDLLAVDDKGELWLIEAKLRVNNQSDAAYVFGNQLMRYANHLKENGVNVMHRGLQGYAFGRRSILKPPPLLAKKWQFVHSLEDMLFEWGQIIGVDDARQFGVNIYQNIGQRIRDGNFIAAVLTDHIRAGQKKWIQETYEPNNIQGGLLTIDDGQITVVYRSHPKALNPEDVGHWDPERFNKIPQSYKPEPETFARIINDTAYRLWSEVLKPYLIDALTETHVMQLRKNVCSSASFGYFILMKNDLPLFLRIGRGDKYIATNGTKIPGQHTLKMDINFVWAVAQIHENDDAAVVTTLQDDLWAIVCQLITKCGYRIKGLSGIEYCQIPAKESYLNKITNSSELILERFTKNGQKDFGNTPGAYQEDAIILIQAMDIVLDCLQGSKPYKLMERPKRNMRKVIPDQ